MTYLFVAFKHESDNARYTTERAMPIQVAQNKTVIAFAVTAGVPPAMSAKREKVWLPQP